MRLEQGMEKAGKVPLITIGDGEEQGGFLMYSIEK